MASKQDGGCLIMGRELPPKHQSRTVRSQVQFSYLRNTTRFQRSPGAGTTPDSHTRPSCSTSSPKKQQLGQSKHEVLERRPNTGGRAKPTTSTSPSSLSYLSSQLGSKSLQTELERLELATSQQRMSGTTERWDLEPPPEQLIERSKPEGPGKAPEQHKRCSLARKTSSLEPEGEEPSGCTACPAPIFPPLPGVHRV